MPSDDYAEYCYRPTPINFSLLHTKMTKIAAGVCIMSPATSYCPEREIISKIYNWIWNYSHLPSIGFVPFYSILVAHSFEMSAGFILRVVVTSWQSGSDERMRKRPNNARYKRQEKRQNIISVYASWINQQSMLFELFILRCHSLENIRQSIW